MAPLAWLLKLLLLSINIRASQKALVRPSSQKERKTMNSADRARRRAMKEQLTCWVVFMLFIWAERLSDRTVAYVLPFYGQFKLVLLLLMVAWRSVGAEIIFKKLVKPVMLPYERPLDAVGYMLGEVLELLLAALLFFPKRVAQWWQGKSAEPDIPSIMAGLRSPHRPPLARALASSIESAQAKSTAQVSERFSRPVVDRAEQEEETLPAPRLTIRRPPSNAFLSASTSLRPTSSSSIPFRPSKSVNSREHQSLGASTSRFARGEASSSRSSAGGTLYPSLPTPQAPSEVWGTSRAATSRPLAPSTSHKGKHRETLEPLPIPAPAPVPSQPLRRSLATSTSQPIDLGRTSLSARSSLSFPSPPSPPQPSPPRAALSFFVPPTPAPPGAFRPSYSPVRLPRAAAVVQEEQRVAASSPRQKASSAIAGLAMELDATDAVLGMSFGPGKKKTRGVSAGVENGRKRARLGEKEISTARRTGKTRRRVDSESESEEAESEDEYVEEVPKKTKATSPRKRKAPTRDEDDSTGTETDKRVASKRLATSTRRTTTSTGIPLARSRTSRPIKAAPPSPSPSVASSDDEELRRPAPSRKKVTSARSTVVAPTRKARRVVLGRQQDTEQELEVDGVPVVVRKAGRR